MLGMLIENANVDDDADDAVERQSAHISTHYMHIAVHVLARSLCIYCISSQRDNQSAKLGQAKPSQPKIHSDAK